MYEHTWENLSQAPLILKHDSQLELNAGYFAFIDQIITSRYCTAKIRSAYNDMDETIPDVLGIKTYYPVVSKTKETVKNEFGTRMGMEVIALTALQDLSIAPSLYDVHSDPGRRGLGYIAIEHFADMVALSELVGKGSHLDPRVIIDIIAKLCDYMNLSHMSGVIHNDVKLANILVKNIGSNEFDMRILDWEMAKLTSLAKDKPRNTKFRLRNRYGTVPYGSPESYNKNVRITPASDIYSIGIALYGLLTNTDPRTSVKSFYAGPGTVDPFATYNYMLEMIKTTLKGKVHDELIDIIIYALGFSPRQRFENAQSMAESLKSLHI